MGPSGVVDNKDGESSESPNPIERRYVLCTFFHQGFSEKVQRSVLALAGKSVCGFAEAILLPVGQLYPGFGDGAILQRMAFASGNKAVVGHPRRFKGTKIVVLPPMGGVVRGQRPPCMPLRLDWIAAWGI